MKKLTYLISPKKFHKNPSLNRKNKAPANGYSHNCWTQQIVDHNGEAEGVRTVKFLRLLLLRSKMTRCSSNPTTAMIGKYP